jgi:archaellum component FlaC
LTLTVKLPDNTYVNKIQILEEEAKKWKSNCEKAKSDLLMLVKEREEMENTLIGLRSYREDILKAQEVPGHGISYRNKIEDLEDEINMLKINCEDQKLYALEVKEQLNKLKEEILHAKNTMCSC